MGRTMVRVSRPPRRGAVVETDTLTTAQWRRIAELPERLQRRNELEAAEREARYAAFAKERGWDRELAGDLRFNAWLARNPRVHTVGLEFAAQLLRLPVDALEREAAALGVLLDFRPSNSIGRLLRLRDLTRLARKRLGLPVSKKLVVGA